jgi:glutamine synthetase
VLDRARADGVRFLRLQFTDILGVNKNVEVPASRFAEALAGEVLFDGAAIEGFERPEESDMLLRPDLATYQLLPWGAAEGDGARVARVICDVTTTDGAAFAGDPRAVLRRQLAAAAERGYLVRANAEVEFFLFRAGPDGAATTATHDVGGYFDLAPVDQGEDARRAMVDLLERLGVPVVGAHHEGAHGQHEIDLGDADALAAADHVVTLRFVVKHVARQYGLVASFMPKPVFGQNGSGMHTHQALFAAGAHGAQGANGAGAASGTALDTALGTNAFDDPGAEWGLSRTALHYVGGLLRHARGMCAVTNPLVNSYKRLVPGFEAPVHVAWSLKSRTPLVRVPERRGAATRLEVRTPDPAANPYLALAVMVAAGLDGVATGAEWREPVAQEVDEMSYRERRRLRVDDLPHDLNEACDELERDDVMRAALGPHVAQRYLAAKRREWREYSGQVTRWELERYLGRY